MPRLGRAQPTNFLYSDDLSFGSSVDLTGAGAVSDGAAGVLSTTLPLAGQGTAAGSSSTVDIVPVPPVAGYVGWYDAADISGIVISTIVTDYDAVSVWQDKSDTGNDLTQGDSTLQPSTDNRTINSLNVIDFQLGRFLATLNVPLVLNTGTLFAVVQKDSGSRLISFTDGLQNDFDNTAGIAYVDFNDDGTAYDTALVVSGDGVHPVFDSATPTLYMVQRNATVWTGRANGVNLTGGASVDTAFNASNLGVGGYPTGQSTASGAVAEIIIYNTVLTAPQIARVETYLTTKWFAGSPVSVTGSGGNASRGTGDLSVTQSLAGSGNSASTATANVNRAASLTGQGSAADGSQLLLRATASLTGHGDSSSATTDTLTVTVVSFVALAAAGAGVVAGPSPLVLSATLAGAGAATAVGRADLVLAAPLAGNGTATAAGRAPLNLALKFTGSGANAAQSSSSVLDNKANLASPVGNVASPTAALTLAVDLSGHGDAANASANTRLFYTIGLEGAGANSSAGTGQLRFAWALAGFGAAAAASPTALLSLVFAIAARGAAAAGGSAPLLSILPDPIPVTFTIADTGHTYTIWDRGHTRTLVDNS